MALTLWDRVILPASLGAWAGYIAQFQRSETFALVKGPQSDDPQVGMPTVPSEDLTLHSLQPTFVVGDEVGVSGLTGTVTADLGGRVYEVTVISHYPDLYTDKLTIMTMPAGKLAVDNENVATFV